MSDVRRLATVLSVAFLSSAFPFGRAATNGPIDGNSLLHECSQALAIRDDAKNVTNDAYHCAGYVQGARDIGDLFGARPNGGPLWCLPGEVSTEQTIRVVVKYLKENPADLHRPAVALVAVALASAFPCPDRGKESR